MLHITLGDRRPVDPKQDELGRTHVGYEPGMSDAEMYEANRGCWVLGERADEENYALFSHKGVVKMAMTIDRIEATTSKRRALVGRVLTAGDRVHDIYVGGPALIQKARNPITYVEDPRFDARLCACGCGTQISRGDWVPGHDQKALHERIARVGSVKQFVQWFDEHFQPAAPGQS